MRTLVTCHRAHHNGSIVGDLCINGGVVHFLTCIVFLFTPNSSMNAPLVPEPSSREMTLICPEKSPPAAVLSPSVLPSASVAEASFVVSAVEELLLSLLPHPASIPAAIIAVKVIAIAHNILFSLFTGFCDFYFVNVIPIFLHFVLQVSS